MTPDKAQSCALFNPESSTYGNVPLFLNRLHVLQAVHLVYFIVMSVAQKTLDTDLNMQHLMQISVQIILVT